MAPQTAPSAFVQRTVAPSMPSTSGRPGSWTTSSTSPLDRRQPHVAFDRSLLVVSDTGLEEHQIPYDSVDALVDAYWQTNPSELPETIEYRRLAEIARSVGTAEERWAVEHFSSRVAPATPISLTGALALNHAAMQQLQGMTEASSARRNAVMAMKYPLVLSALARRLLWRTNAPETAASKARAACGQRGIGGFVAGRR